MVNHPRTGLSPDRIFPKNFSKKVEDKLRSPCRHCDRAPSVAKGAATREAIQMAVLLTGLLRRSAPRKDGEARPGADLTAAKITWRLSVFAWTDHVSREDAKTRKHDER